MGLGGTYMYDLYEEVGLPVQSYYAFTALGQMEGVGFCFAGHIGNIRSTEAPTTEWPKWYRNRKTIMCVPTKIDLALVFYRSRTTSSRTKICGLYNIHI